MKLFLSSWDPQGAPSELREFTGRNSACALILNANDAAPAEFRSNLQTRVTAYLRAAGLEPFELDLRDYNQDSADELGQRLATAGLVWAHGGNAFVLRSAMRRSGFDAIIADLLVSEELAYGGCSAGAIVVGTTLRGVDLADPTADLDVVGGDLIWDGIGLVEYAIAPHYRSAAPIGRDIDAFIASLERDHIPYRTLRDGDSIRIFGASERLIDHSTEALEFQRGTRSTLT